MVTKFLLFQLVIIVPFFSGSVLSNRFKNLPDTAKKMITLNLTVFEPPIIFWSIWGLSLQLEMAILPLIGTAIVLMGFMLGKALMFFYKMDLKSEKTFVISSALANHGFTLGGFLCFILAGERGLALSAIFLVYFIPVTFLFIFSYAGFNKGKAFSLKSYVNFFLTARNMPILAVIVAVLIRSLGIQRPDVFFPLDILLVVSISVYYFTLGINFIPGDLNPFKREHFILAAQKFIVIPVLIFLFLQFVNLSNEIKSVIVIQAFMPTAIYTVITSLMFDLNSRLASSLFVVNSLVFILLVLPLLFYFKEALMF